MNAAKPEAQAQKLQRHRKVLWDDRFVEELKLRLLACQILLFFPFHWLCPNQTFNNLISQAGQMVNSGLPNAAIRSVNAFTSVIFYPLVQKGVYPWLRRKHIDFRSAARITFGFFLLTAAMAYVAGLQQLIYNSGPCYDAPLNCPALDGGRIPNHISMTLQIPIFSVGAMAEMFCLTTGTEHAYNQALKSDFPQERYAKRNGILASDRYRHLIEARANCPRELGKPAPGIIRLFGDGDKVSGVWRPFSRSRIHDQDM